MATEKSLTHWLFYPLLEPACEGRWLYLVTVAAVSHRLGGFEYLVISQVTVLEWRTRCDYE